MPNNTTVLVLHADTQPGRAALEAVRLRGMRKIAITRFPAKLTNLDKEDLVFSVDTTDVAAVEKLGIELQNKGILVDILVTSPTTNIGELETTSQDIFDKSNKWHWESILNENLLSATLFCRIFGEKMRSRGQGRIVQLVSNLAFDPYRPQDYINGSGDNAKACYALAAYSCSMAAVAALSRHLAVDFGSSGVLINNLVFGPLLELESPSVVKQYPQRVPLARIMTLGDLTNAIDFFLHPMSNYVTGQNLFCDGGVAIW